MMDAQGRWNTKAKEMNTKEPQMDINDVKDALEVADYQLTEDTAYGKTYVKDFPGDKFYNEVFLDTEVNKVEFNRYNYKDTLLAYDAFTIDAANTRSILGRISRH
jgi:hypothetical protein